MSSDTRGSEVLDPVSILLTRYQSVNRDILCMEKIRKTRTIGIRIPQLAWSLYHEVLTDEDKEHVKYLVESLVLALAREKLGELPCEDMLGKRLSYTAARVTGSAHAIFNITINKNNNEVKHEVNINVKPRDIEDIIQLIDYLWSSVEKDLPMKTKRVLANRVARAKKLLDQVIVSIN